MLIRKPTKNEAFIARVDAESRLTVCGINMGNTPQIAKLGLSKIQQGIVSSDGAALLAMDQPGLVLSQKMYSCPGDLRLMNDGHPAGSFLPVVRENYLSSDYKIIQEVTPQDIPNLYRAMGTDIDSVYTVEKLGWNKRDMDKVSGPKLYRSFSDSSLYRWIGYFNFYCRKEDGTFKAIYGFVGEEIFEIKIFKFSDRPEEFRLMFKPTTSAVDIPYGKEEIVLSLDALTVWKERERGPFVSNVGWLCIAGDMKDDDWGIVKRYDGRVFILWPDFPDDPLLTRNCFAEAMAVVTEARKRKIRIGIIHARGRAEADSSWYEADPEKLSDDKIKMLAVKYGVGLDPVWNCFPGEISCNEEPLGTIPHCWHWGYAACFFGKNSNSFMMDFLKDTAKKRTHNRILIVVPERYKKWGKELLKLNKKMFMAVTYDAFKNKDLFLEKIREHSISLILIAEYSDCKEKLSEEILESVCKSLLPVGIFTDDENESPWCRDWEGESYCVRMTRAKTFFLKEMKASDVKKYDFNAGALTISPAEEIEMREGE